MSDNDDDGTAPCRVEVSGVLTRQDARRAGTMVHEADLIEKAQHALGADTNVIAAGVFGLQDNYAALLAGGAVAGGAASLIGGGAATNAAMGTAAIIATREVMAQSKGVTVRMLVAVSDQDIVLFALDALGTTPERELMRFNRATTTCEESKFGASRHLKLTDTATNNEIGLTGSAAFFSNYAEGDKAVLTELGPTTDS